MLCYNSDDYMTYKTTLTKGQRTLHLHRSRVLFLPGKRGFLLLLRTVRLLHERTYSESGFHRVYEEFSPLRANVQMFEKATDTGGISPGAVDGLCERARESERGKESVSESGAKRALHTALR